MSDFLVSSDRVAYRVVDLDAERHPERVSDVIDGMIREFRLHPDAARRGRIVYVPVDLPPETTDAWVARYLERDHSYADG
jgi:hypothetical protein